MTDRTMGEERAQYVVFRLEDQRWAILREPANKLIEHGLLERLDRGLAIVDETRIRTRRGKKE